MRNISITQKTSKGDSRRQGSKVDEDDGSQDLGIQGVCEVADVVAVAALDVLYHSPKRNPCTGQGVLTRLLRTTCTCTNKCQANQ